MTTYLIFGIIGLIIISYAIWLKNEKRQDELFVLGGIFLLIYSVSIHDLVFIVLQVVFIASALIEIAKKRKK